LQETREKWQSGGEGLSVAAALIFFCGVAIRLAPAADFQS
jgi:hypothetical protein